MRSVSVAVMALGLLILGVAAAQAAVITGPSATLTAGGETFQVPLIRTEKGWVIGEGENEGEPSWTIRTDEFEVMLSGELNPDPSIAYGIAAVDFGAPTAFLFGFFTPIVPTGAPNTVTGSIVGGLTDFTGDGVSLTPLAATTQVSEVQAAATNMGVDVGAAFAAGPAAPGSFYGYGPFASGPKPGPGPGPWTAMLVTTGFTLSGNGDIAALTGFSSIVEDVVPEPLTLGLLGLGLGAVVYVRRRRRA